jgi:hypothetical protein
MDDDFWIETTADCWFDAAHQAKEHGFLDDIKGVEPKSFAFNMGKIAHAGGRPAPKQYPIAKEIWLIYQQFLRDQIVQNNECKKECYKGKLPSKHAK